MKKDLKPFNLKKEQIVKDGCMITVSGILIDLYNPNPELILIDDIAHGLANNCRWNGHTQQFWSVAQHCCMMYDVAPTEQKLSYLFHDAEEAYWGDMIKPLKNKIRDKCPEVIDLMSEMRRTIFKKFNIPELSVECMIDDFKLLQWEFENIIKTNNTVFWTPKQAKSEWIQRYKNEQN
jgi:5'-deoxynucleotidase YfbR-like HD superfamily hydrolase